MNASTDRRAFLVAVAGATTTAIAGCVGGGSEIGDDDASGELGDPTGSVEVDINAEPMLEFAPSLVHLVPGGTVTWTVVDDFRHTVTTYHPDTFGPQRIPDGAEPWNSGFLRQGDAFEWTIEQEGIYDYVDTRTMCSSHEAIGGVGRVVVGWPDLESEPAYRHDVRTLPSRAETVLAEHDERCRDVLE